MAKNKKIVNATPTVYNNIEFKSKLECSIYKVLVAEGLNPKYEPQKFIIWEGFKPSIPFYRRDKKTKILGLENTKIKDITYAPDLVFEYNGHTVFIEVKPDGFTNDVYPYKQKLFRKYLENKSDIKPIFVRVGTIRNLKEFITILKNNYNEES